MTGRVWSYRQLARDQFQITADGLARAEVLFDHSTLAHAAIVEFTAALARLYGEPFADPRTLTVSVVAPTDTASLLGQLLDLLIAVEQNPSDLGAWGRLELAVIRQCDRLLDPEGSAA